MKNKGIIILIITLIVIALVTGLAFLTLYFINRQPINKIDLAALENKEDVKIVYEEDSEIPTLIAGKYTEFKVNSGNEAIRALEEVKDVIGIQNPKEEYKVSNEIEILNSNVYRMQQYYKGIQVLGRQMVMATDKEGNIKTLSGDYVKIENLDVTPSINQNGAISVITGKYGDDKYLSLDMEGVNESQLVHNNSTVLSRAFYLMWKNGLTTDEISQIMLETCVRLSRFAEYNEIIEMIRILAEEYCPEKVDIVTDALVETGYMYYIEDEQGNNNNGTTTTEQDIADIYKQFIIDKGYEKDEDEYFEETKKESIEPGKIQAGDHTISYGIYRSNLAEYEMLGGIYIIRKDGTYTYRNIWKNYAGEVNTVNISGTYTVQYFDELDIDEAGWAIKFTSNSDEIMGNTVLEINENDSFEAGQYPNKFTLIQ